MNLFKEMAKFVGWLSGSLAGLGAILYAFGYLITRAHLHLLGISLDYRNEHYMQEGAKFFLVFADLIGRIFLPLLISLGVIAVFAGLPIMIVFFVCRFSSARARVEELSARAAAKWANILAKWPWSWRVLIFSGLLLLLFFAIEMDLNLFSAPLSISDLLYQHQDNLQEPGAGEKALLRSWILAGNLKSLDNYFFGLVLAELKVVVLLLIALRVAWPWRFRSLMLAPFAVVFMMYLILLPMNYGVLMRPAKFARISLITTGEGLVNKNSDLFLLDRNDKEFVLWDSTEKRALWIPTGGIKAAELKQMEFLFKDRK